MKRRKNKIQKDAGEIAHSRHSRYWIIASAGIALAAIAYFFFTLAWFRPQDIDDKNRPAGRAEGTEA